MTQLLSMRLAGPLPDHEKGNSPGPRGTMFILPQAPLEGLTLQDLRIRTPRPFDLPTPHHHLGNHKSETK